MGKSKRFGAEEGNMADFQNFKFKWALWEFILYNVKIFGVVNSLYYQMFKLFSLLNM